jgi:hypothetical protein
MKQRIFEGTWEEILLHAPELVGQRVRLTVLSNENLKPQNVVTLDRQSGASSVSTPGSFYTYKRCLRRSFG